MTREELKEILPHRIFALRQIVLNLGRFIQ